MNDTSKKFDHFTLGVSTYVGDKHASLSFNLEATDREGRVMLQDLDYKSVKKLCAVIGNMVIKEVKNRK